MKPVDLKYDAERALRYSAPPSMVAFESANVELLDRYSQLIEFRAGVVRAHRKLVEKGVFQSIPTLTSETKNGRPGVFWRAVFRTNSGEVLAGMPRKHYIGSKPEALSVWRVWIVRSRLAMDMDQLIFDIGQGLRQAYRSIAATNSGLGRDVVRYSDRSEAMYRES